MYEECTKESKKRGMNVFLYSSLLADSRLEQLICHCMFSILYF